jgi:hypothetical protein
MLAAVRVFNVSRAPTAKYAPRVVANPASRVVTVVRAVAFKERYVSMAKPPRHVVSVVRSVRNAVSENFVAKVNVRRRRSPRRRAVVVQRDQVAAVAAVVAVVAVAARQEREVLKVLKALVVPVVRPQRPHARAVSKTVCVSPSLPRTRPNAARRPKPAAIVLISVQTSNAIARPIRAKPVRHRLPPAAVASKMASACRSSAKTIHNVGRWARVAKTVPRRGRRPKRVTNRPIVAKRQI